MLHNQSSLNYQASMQRKTSFITDHTFSLRHRFFVDCDEVFFLPPFLARWRERKKKMCATDSHALATFNISWGHSQRTHNHPSMMCLLTSLNPLSVPAVAVVEVNERRLSIGTFWLIVLKRVSRFRGVNWFAQPSSVNFWSDWALNSLWNSARNWITKRDFWFP